MEPIEMAAAAGLGLAVLWAMSGGKAKGKARPGRTFLESLNELRLDAAAQRIEKTIVEAEDNPHLAGLAGLFKPKAEGDGPKAG